MIITADILNITTPITPKDYQMPKYGQNQSAEVAGQVFNLGDQTKIVKTNERSDEQAQQDLKDGGLSIAHSSVESKGVSGTLDAVKELLSPAALAALTAKNDMEALNKLTEFASEVILKPENLAADLVNQQKNATIFSGKLWDALRFMSRNAGSEDFSAAVLDFAKAAANNAEKGEILRSLSSNFAYLSRELAPNKEVANELMQASEALAGPDIARNYSALKSTLVRLVNYTNESLLLDNRSQNLLPLIIHTMSRYNDDPSALRRSFETLLNIFDNLRFGDKTLKELNDILAPSGDENTAQSAQTEQTAQAASGQASSRSREETYLSEAEMLRNAVAGGGAEDRPASAPEQNISLGRGFTFKAPEDMTPQERARASLEKLFDDFILKADLPTEVKSASVINKNIIAEQEKLNQSAKLLTIGIQNMASRVDASRLKDVLSGIDPHRGMASVKLVLASVTPNTPAMADALDKVIAHYEKSGDLSGLIDRLGSVLDVVDDLDKKIPMVQLLNETLSDMASEADSNYRPPTSLDTLADFLIKNINDTALQSLTSMNQSDIVQNMLTNPGPFNPLMHFFVPLDAYGMRAFAEVWVDKNDGRDTSVNNDRGDEDTNHIFMCFDMENVGYFEMEMFAKGRNISVMLLCPEGTEKTFKPLSQSVPRIAAASGYAAGTTIIDTLYRKRDLSKVFPDLNKRKGGFDAKA